jgi:hypothetical protein
MKRSSLQRGQVLLLGVLVITVILTVALSMMARSIVNVRLTVEEDLSKKALAAAEAGIEKSLIANTAATGLLTNNSEYATAYTPVTGATFSLNNGRIVAKDEGADIWLSDYSSDPTKIYKNSWSGTLTIYWGSASDTCDASEAVNTRAAIEVVVISGNKNNPVLNHYAYDSCATRRGLNNFSTTNAGATVNGRSYARSAAISVTNGLIARVIPLYANSYIGVQGSAALPSQGTLIQSTGTSGDVKRTVTVLQENPQLPAEFMTYLFLWPK